MTDPKIQILASFGLISSPLLADWLSTINSVAGTITFVCGAVMGVYGVYKTFFKKDKE